MPQAAERKALEKGLHKLNENMVTLAELAELSIRKAVDGLTRLDPEVAQEVFTLDQEVYGLQLEIERTCIDLLALMHPSRETYGRSRRRSRSRRTWTESAGTERT